MWAIACPALGAMGHRTKDDVSHPQMFANLGSQMQEKRKRGEN